MIAWVSGYCHSEGFREYGRLVGSRSDVSEEHKNDGSLDCMPEPGDEAFIRLASWPEAP